MFEAQSVRKLPQISHSFSQIFSQIKSKYCMYIHAYMFLIRVYKGYEGKIFAIVKKSRNSQNVGRQKFIIICHIYCTGVYVHMYNIIYIVHVESLWQEVVPKLHPLKLVLGWDGADSRTRSLRHLTQWVRVGDI